MKTCRDIARDIEMLQHRIRNSRVVEMTISLLESSASKNCKSVSCFDTCEHSCFEDCIQCNCGKIKNETSLESKKTI
jgi:hypothetical protein